MTIKTMPAMEQNDAELVADSLDGSRDAFRRIVERYQTLICSLAYSATGNVSRSEDMAQETFIAAWKQLRALREPAKSASAQTADAGASRLAPTAASATGAQISAAPPGRALRYSGWALSVAGLAVLAPGIYLWSVDGEPARPDYVRDTRKYGLPMTIAGGVVLAAGAGLVAWSFWAGPAKITVGPSGLRVAGSF